MNPLASIIILNLNGERFLKDCFESLRGQTFKNFEIIFVDNGSADQSVLWVEKNYKEAKIIRNKANLGFAKANNQGFELTRGKYIITLNNDTRVEKSWLENLISAAEKNELAGMCASRIISMDGSGRIDSTGVNMCLDGMSRSR
ncbi:MAG: glycosyltransferase family 2 protein, partial [Candidatus Parcubacteria bacterium]|nr:glycosyltransferase family 2 protein [Candidatus Parcubacteria bacterium]